MNVATAVEAMAKKYGLSDELKEANQRLTDLGFKLAEAELTQAQEDKSLFSALLMCQRVTDFFDKVLVRVVNDSGIHPTCAKRIGSQYTDDVTERVVKTGAAYTQSLADLCKMLVYDKPNTLTELIDAAHRFPPVETKNPVGTEGGDPVEAPPETDQPKGAPGEEPSASDQDENANQA